MYAKYAKIVIKHGEYDNLKQHLNCNEYSSRSWRKSDDHFGSVVCSNWHCRLTARRSCLQFMGGEAFSVWSLHGLPQSKWVSLGQSSFPHNHYKTCISVISSQYPQLNALMKIWIWSSVLHSSSPLLLRRMRIKCREQILLYITYMTLI